MRLLWACQYRLYKWLQRHTYPPRDVADYLAAYPRMRSELKVTLGKMAEVFAPYKVQPELDRDPECGGVDLCVRAYVPTSMPFDEADRLLGIVWDWQIEDSVHNIFCTFDWVEA